MLKGEKKRPRFKPSQLDRRAGREEGAFEALLNAHLTRLEITQERHRRIATEGALLGSVSHHSFPKDLP